MKKLITLIAVVLSTVYAKAELFNISIWDKEHSIEATNQIWFETNVVESLTPPPPPPQQYNRLNGIYGYNMTMAATVDFNQKWVTTTITKHDGLIYNWRNQLWTNDISTNILVNTVHLKIKYDWETVTN